VRLDEQPNHVSPLYLPYISPVRLDEQRQLVGVAQVREVGATLERRELGAIRQRGEELVRVRVRVNY